ncbi:hypothetical protein CJO96_04855 [Ralstonia solanacearum]|uniref:efflux RND transporter permease subunit n=1 Tax=Ralstonia pseudosolanacearum TaxID=1310165 RepID=UPI000E58C2EB|nr:hypothetical protein CJO84_04750 [Ralstonia solanacearum]AXW37668.1 hypothetical protein CJO89_04785 [Ralstonia solanacearum]AXW70530.1 hypothetical protein CJO96_04855 [Ralstonia solanacearum]BEU66410.1 hypothetical protein MAFF301069_09650 [Ralstonia pseudosolanacearum]
MCGAVSTILAQKLSQVGGIGDVEVGGGALPAVRVELHLAALASANVNQPKGFVGEGDRQWQIGASDQAKTAAEYLPLVVAFRNGAAACLSDVAEVVDSVEDVRNAGLVNTKPVVLPVLFRQPGANIIDTVKRVNALLPVLRACIPCTIDLNVMMARTSTICAPLRGAELALMVSVYLVILMVFLCNVRATVIPAVAMPVSLTM